MDISIFKYKKLYFLWFIPIIELQIFPSSFGNIYSFLIPLTYLILKIFQNKFIYLVHSLPYLVLLSPMSNNFGGVILYSELFLILIVLLTSLYFLKNIDYLKVRIIDFNLLIMFILIVFSFILSFEYTSLYKGLLNAIFLFSSFIFTRIYINSLKEIFRFITSMFFAVTFLAIIMITYYYYGFSLNSLDFQLLGKIDIYLTSGFGDGIANSQANYIYTNVFYLIGGMIILSPSLLNFINNKKIKILFLFCNLILIAAILFNFNKTSIFALLIILFISFLINLHKRKVIKLSYLFYFFILSSFVYYIFNFQITHSYRGFNISSLTARFEVFTSTFNQFSENIFLLLYGFGPESLFRSQYNEIIKLAKTRGGVQEGAIDSGYLSYMFEYGFLFVFILIFYLTILFLKLFFQRFIYQDNKLNLIMKKFYQRYAFFIVYVMIVALFQVLGVGKVAILVFQLIACASTLILISQDKINENIY